MALSQMGLKRNERLRIAFDDLDPRPSLSFTKLEMMPSAIAKSVGIVLKIGFFTVKI